MIFYYAALSVDGYMADFETTNPVKWLDEFNLKISKLEKNDPILNSYKNVMSNTKTIIMGSKTYEDILGFGIKWPYIGYENYVLTTKKDKYRDSNIKEFLSLEELKKEIKNLDHDIFILGGGNLAGQLIDEKLIDKIILTQMPVLLGEGVPFFQNVNKQQLTLKRIDSSESFVELEYDILH